MSDSRLIEIDFSLSVDVDDDIIQMVAGTAVESAMDSLFDSYEEE